MNRVEFNAKVCLAKAIKDKEVLLGYFVSDTKYNINEVINELEMVQKGETTFEDLLEDSEGWPIADGFGGMFTCDQKTAFFTADENSNLPNMQMPLKELLEILYEWKAFLGR